MRTRKPPCPQQNQIKLKTKAEKKANKQRVACRNSARDALLINTLTSPPNIAHHNPSLHLTFSPTRTPILTNTYTPSHPCIHTHTTSTITSTPAQTCTLTKGHTSVSPMQPHARKPINSPRSHSSPNANARTALRPCIPPPHKRAIISSRRQYVISGADKPVCRPLRASARCVTISTLPPTRPPWRSVVEMQAM